MYIDTDLLFNKLVGYEFYHRCEVKAVIMDKLICKEGESLAFYDDIEFLIEEFDEIIIFRKRKTVQDLYRQKKYLIEEGKFELLNHIKLDMEEAKIYGTSERYACIHNDTYYLLDDFSF